VVVGLYMNNYRTRWTPTEQIICIGPMSPKSIDTVEVNVKNVMSEGRVGTTLKYRPKLVSQKNLKPSKTLRIFGYNFAKTS